MAVKPTEEQLAARDMFVAGRELALVAGAGTGKTSTLVLMAGATHGPGLYVAFNKAIAKDARRHFRADVDCRTAHSLAYREPDGSCRIEYKPVTITRWPPAERVYGR